MTEDKNSSGTNKKCNTCPAKGKLGELEKIFEARR